MDAELDARAHRRRKTASATLLNPVSSALTANAALPLLLLAALLAKLRGSRAHRFFVTLFLISVFCRQMFAVS